MESLIARTRAADGTGYLQPQSRAERLLTGRVYTPSHLVRFVLSEAGYDASSPIADKPVLDPSCGAGAFIERLIAVQVARAKLAGLDVSARRGFVTLLQRLEQQA